MAAYSNESLLELARKNYDRLTAYCSLLDEEGYWKQPEQVLKQSIQEFLDLYLQAVLLSFALDCNRFAEKEREFIQELPKNKMFDLHLWEDEQDEMKKKLKNVLNSPPILLQLCGVRDVEQASDISVYFFDNFLNILLSMANLDNGRDNECNGFIQRYYESTAAFLNQEKVQELINPRYMFRKISSDHFESELQKIKDEERQMKASPMAAKPETVTYREKTDLEDDLEWEDELELEEEPEADEELEAEEELETGEETEIEEKAEPAEPEKKISKLEEYLNELNALVGLQEVKTEINSLINLIKVRKMRESFNLPAMEMSYHMVFTGEPGTGKTTVARLVAKIYKELGLLSKGNLVETDRSGLVAGYIGQTAIKVKEVTDRAIGGVLFIDEAYSLTNGGAQNDFGSEAIDTLVKVMEDHRDDLVVIVAGYRKEMKEFLASNTGLVSRFNKFIDFADYTIEELLEILDVMAGKAGIHLEEDARAFVKTRLEEFDKEDFRRFGNARGIRNLFEKIMVNQANRLVTYEAPTLEQLSQIIREDAEKCNF